MIDSIMALPPFASVSVDSRDRQSGGPWRRVSSMRRIIAAGIRACGRRVEAAFGIDQERALGRDLFAGGESLQHREAVADAGSRTTSRPS